MMPSISFSLRFSASFLVALAGCATPPEAPRVEKVLIPVPQPYEIKCEIPPAPAWPMDALPLGAQIDEQVKALLAERALAKGYIIELQVACK